MKGDIGYENLSEYMKKEMNRDENIWMRETINKQNLWEEMKGDIGYENLSEYMKKEISGDEIQ